MNIPGVDISALQGNVNFAAVAASGIQFVIIRCGVGNGGIDALFKHNVAAATAAGLKVMAYHFVYPLPPLASQPLRDPIKQAQYHFNAAGPNILAACDFEWPAPQDWAKWGCTATQIKQWCLAYLTEYERLTNQKMVVYTYPYFAASLKLDPAFAKYPLWVASYEPSPAVIHPWTDWVLWQYGSGGIHKLPNGVEVDVDYARDLSLWDALPGAPVVAPVVNHQPDPPLDPPTPTPVPAPPPAPVPVPTPDPNAIVVPPSIQKDIGIISGVVRWLVNLFKEELPKL